ncbi:MAG: TetR/AcrR family transcriptional regulator [Rhodocyclaceae bacterium]
MEVPRTRLSTEARQAGIVAVVLKLAAERSPAEITTGDIAKALNLTQGAVFKHFPSKDAICLAVLDWVEENLLAALRQAETQSATPLDGLQRVFMAHVHFVMQYPGVPRIIFNDLQRPDDTPLKQRVRSILRGYRQILARLLADAGEQRLIAHDLDAGAAATLFIGTVQGLVMQSMLAGSSAQMDDEAQRAFALYLRAIREAA